MLTVSTCFVGMSGFGFDCALKARVITLKSFFFFFFSFFYWTTLSKGSFIFVRNVDFYRHVLLTRLKLTFWILLTRSTFSPLISKTASKFERRKSSKSIWSSRESNRGPPGRHESALSIRQRRPLMKSILSPIFLSLCLTHINTLAHTMKKRVRD